MSGQVRTWQGSRNEGVSGSNPLIGFFDNLPANSSIFALFTAREPMTTLRLRGNSRRLDRTKLAVICLQIGYLLRPLVNRQRGNRFHLGPAGIDQASSQSVLAPMLDLAYDGH